MERFRNNKYFTPSEAIGVVFVSILFVGALFVSHYYGDTIENIVFLDGPLGMLLYVLLAFLSVVIAPAAALPFLPIAVSLWGSITAALLSIAGWFAGAVIAFLLARRFGRPFVGKFMSINRAENIARRITGRYTFGLVLVSRMILPTDVVSYAIGLFVPIHLIPYSIATLIGIIPLAFGLAYGVALPLQLQATVFAIALAIIATVVVALLLQARWREKIR